MKLENLRSLIRESINEYIREIDDQGTGAMYEAKKQACAAAIEKREAKLRSIEENEELKEMVDATKLKDIQKEINELKKYLKKLEKLKDKHVNKGKKKEVVSDTETEEAPLDEADVTAEMDLEEAKKMSKKGKKDEKEMMNESFLKMQKLAGLITESEYNKKKRLVENRIINDTTFKWNKTPADPNAMLMNYDEDEEITKASFWETDITDRPTEDTIPNYAQEENGKWRFGWEAGDIGGFVEGEDFTF